MFAKDGYSTLLVVSIFAVIAIFGASYLGHWSKYIIWGAVGVLTLIVFYFFRDPDRNIPQGENLILAPADGKIVQIRQIEEPNYLNDSATQVSIFLNLLDVHVNRIPATGNIEYAKYHPGEYLVAWHEKASEKNERAEFGILHPSGVKIYFRQITGLVARRIVYRIEEGDDVKAGRRFGMMKFGSRMDVVVPGTVQLNVKEGERTVGGETVMGVITDEN